LDRPSRGVVRVTRAWVAKPMKATCKAEGNAQVVNSAMALL
jgi:hypothetical protein